MHLFASILLWGLVFVYCSRPSGQITQLNQNTQEQHWIGQNNQPTPTSKDIILPPYINILTWYELSPPHSVCPCVTWQSAVLSICLSAVISPCILGSSARSLQQNILLCVRILKNFPILIIPLESLFSKHVLIYLPVRQLIHKPP